MELSSPPWTFDPTRFELSPGLQALLDLRLDILDETNLAALRGGLWWVYPLGRSFSSQLVGLRLLPGVPLAESPVVVAEGSEAVTLCARAAALVPTRVFQGLVVGGGQWQRVAGMSEGGWREAVALHRALGGTDELAALRALLDDGALAAAIDVGSDDYPRWVRAIAEARGRLDGSAASAAYWRYAAETAVTRTVTSVPPEAGCWNPALASLLFWAARQQRAELERAAAWWLVHAPPALDSSRSGLGLAMEPSSRKARELGVSAAKVVVKAGDAAWAGDALLPAIAALATTAGYDGGEHVAAAAALVRAGELVSAFTALTAAAYWECQARGSAGTGGLDAAVELAERAGTADVAAALAQLREAWAALEAEADPDEEG